MTISTIITILLITLAIIGVAACAYMYLKERTLDDVRADVYQLFLAAEHRYKESGAGLQKMKWVISTARALLPKWAQLLLSEETFERVIQFWFDAVKDLLDDGKYNQSVEDAVYESEGD